MMDDVAPRAPPLTAVRRRPGNRLGQVEEPQIFALAEVLRVKKLGQADNLRALCGGALHVLNCTREIIVGVRNVIDICTNPTRNYQVARDASEEK